MYYSYSYGVLTTAFVVVGLCMFHHISESLGGPTANPMIFDIQICSSKEMAKLSMYDLYLRSCRSFFCSLPVDMIPRSAVS